MFHWTRNIGLSSLSGAASPSEVAARIEVGPKNAADVPSAARVLGTLPGVQRRGVARPACPGPNLPTGRPAVLLVKGALVGVSETFCSFLIHSLFLGYRWGSK